MNIFIVDILEMEHLKRLYFDVSIIFERERERVSEVLVKDR